MLERIKKTLTSKPTKKELVQSVEELVAQNSRLRKDKEQTHQKLRQREAQLRRYDEEMYRLKRKAGEA